MAAVFMPELEESEYFKDSLRDLAAVYPQIAETVKEFEDLLLWDFVLPEISVSATDLPNVYAIRMDYPALGERGVGRFLVTYHKGPAVLSYPVGAEVAPGSRN